MLGRDRGGPPERALAVARSPSCSAQRATSSSASHSGSPRLPPPPHPAARPPPPAPPRRRRRRRGPRRPPRHRPRTPRRPPAAACADPRDGRPGPRSPRPRPLPGAHRGAGQPQAQLGVRVAGRGGQRALPHVERVRGAAEAGQQHHPVAGGVGGTRGGHPVEQRLGAAQRPAREVPAGGPQQERRRPPVLAGDGEQRRRPHGVVGARRGRAARRPPGGRSPPARGAARWPPPRRRSARAASAARRRARRAGRRPPPPATPPRRRVRAGPRPAAATSTAGRRRARPRPAAPRPASSVEVGQPLLDERGERRRHPGAGPAAPAPRPAAAARRRRRPRGPAGRRAGRARVRGDERRGLRRREPLRPQHPAPASRPSAARPRPVVAGRDDQQQPRRGRGVREVLDEGDGVGVRPVQVLQRQEAAALGGQRPEQPQHALAEHDGRVRLVDAVGPSPSGVQAGSSLRRAGRNGRSSSSAGEPVAAGARPAPPRPPGTRRRPPPPGRSAPPCPPRGPGRPRPRAAATCRCPPRRARRPRHRRPARALSTAERSTASSARRPTSPTSLMARPWGSHSTCTAVGPRKPMIGLNAYVWSGTSRRLGSAAVELLQHDTGLQPRERGAEAVVRAVAEREVLAGFAPSDVEAVGVGEHLGIAVGGADGDEHVGVGGQLHAARARPAGSCAAASGSPRSRSAAPPRPRRGSARGSAHSASQLSRCSSSRRTALPSRFVVVSWPASSSPNRIVDDLLLGERVAVAVGRVHEVGGEVVARVRPAVLGQRLAVAPELRHPGGDLDLLVLACAAEHEQQPVGGARLHRGDVRRGGPRAPGRSPGRAAPR